MSFGRNLSKKWGKELLGTATKPGLNALKTTTKKVVHKAAEATGKFIWNKIADKIVKPKHVTEANLRNIERIIIPREKRDEILNELREVL